MSQEPNNLTGTSRGAMIAKLKAMLVEGLNLEMRPEDIGDSISIFGDDGLGLDSIDALELVVLVEEHFDVAIPDEETGQAVFRSVAVLADYLLAEGSRS